MMMEGGADGTWVAASCARHLCPRCADPLIRVPRRSVDKLLSQYVRVARYRCERHACQWEGNIRARIDAVDSAYLPFGTDTRVPKAPRSFVVAVWLSMTGLAFMLAVGTTEVFALYDARMAEPSMAEPRYAQRIVSAAPQK